MEKSKNQSDNATCGRKTTSDKANLCSNTILSLYLEIRMKKLHAENPLNFFNSLRFGVTKITFELNNYANA